MPNSLITIIVPVYNSEKTLHRCVDSILDQTYQNFEILLINDGSKDHSGDICDEYAKRDTRVRVFHKENNGVSAARNTGLDNAKGAWVSFVDSDDWISSEYLNVLYKEAIVTNADVVTCDFFEVGRNGIRMCNAFDWSAKNFTDINSIGKGQLLSVVISLSYGTVWNSIIAKDLINMRDLRFDINYKYGEDTLFMFQVYMYASLSRHIMRPLYYYDRTNELSATNNITCQYYKNRLSIICREFDLLKETRYINDTHKDLIFEILDRCCPLIFSIQEYPIITEALSRVSNKSIILNNRFSKKQRIALWLLKNGWGQVLYSIVPTNK